MKQSALDTLCVIARHEAIQAMSLKLFSYSVAALRHCEARGSPVSQLSVGNAEIADSAKLMGNAE